MFTSAGVLVATTHFKTVKTIRHAVITSNSGSLEYVTVVAVLRYCSRLVAVRHSY